MAIVGEKDVVGPQACIAHDVVLWNSALPCCGLEDAQGGTGKNLTPVFDQTLLLKASPWCLTVTVY